MTAKRTSQHRPSKGARPEVKKLTKAEKRRAAKARRDVFRHLCADLLEELGSPRTIALASAVREGRDEEVARSVQPDPSVYTSSRDFARDYLGHSLLRKWKHLRLPGVDPSSTALQKWLAVEKLCSELNANGFPEYRDEPCSISSSFAAIMHLAKLKISSILGPVDLNAISNDFGFSGGASTRLPRSEGHPYYKFGVDGTPHVTRGAALMAACALASAEQWRQDHVESFGFCPTGWFTIVPGSRFDMVPKTALVDRPITIEPCMNMYLQQGIGGYIRKRLRKVGIDLNDQSRNQELAREGSLLGNLATIDLASASDSVSMHIVEELLPGDWVALLKATRSPIVVLPSGIEHPLQKVSGMGNGFTFELESLIFFALAWAVVSALDVSEKRIGVYGDDIIVSVDAAERLIQVLRIAGFETNVDKTFCSGPFRESCGYHSFDGSDVTPFYVKEQSGSLSDLYWLANSYRNWCLGVPTPVYHKIVEAIQNMSVVLHVPSYLGLRAGLIVPLNEAWSAKFCRYDQMWKTRMLKARRKKHRPDGNAAVLASVAGYTSPDTGLVLETGTVEWVEKNHRTAAWPNLWLAPPKDLALEY